MYSFCPNIMSIASAGTPDVSATITPDTGTQTPNIVTITPNESATITMPVVNITPDPVTLGKVKSQEQKDKEKQPFIIAAVPR
jgi:hypothetical protein